MPTAKLRVAGMKDGNCEARVEQTLRAQEGVFGAQASREARCVEIDFEDDLADVRALVEVVRSLGYDAELAG